MFWIKGVCMGGPKQSEDNYSGPTVHYLRL
jgi:hypothetical protein